MALYDLAENCQHGDLKEEMICDHLVGILDSALSQKLQLDPKLTPETAKAEIRQREAVREQQQTLKGAESAANPVDSVSAIGNK